MLTNSWLMRHRSKGGGLCDAKWCPICIYGFAWFVVSLWPLWVDEAIGNNENQLMHEYECWVGIKP